MTRRSLRGFEQLESRQLLSVTAQVVSGSLLVQGQADGAVEIRAVDAGKFEVTDNGAAIATVDGVTKGVQIKLDANGGTTDDQVTLDLAGQTVQRVQADLGGGDNQFVLQGGTVSGSLIYRGGKGEDNVQVAADAVVQGTVIADLRQGNNTLDVQGTLNRDLTVLAPTGGDRHRSCVPGRS